MGENGKMYFDPRSGQSTAVLIRHNQDGTVDEIHAENCRIHVEQMGNDSFYLGIDAHDGSYWQFWLGARNHKSYVDVRHTEMTPAKRAPGTA